MKASMQAEAGLNKRGWMTSIPMKSEPMVPMAKFADSELVGRSQKGDMVAYEELVNRYRTKVYSLAFSVIGNPEDANDIAQEAFVRAWRALGRFRGQSSFYTWLYRVTINLGIDWKQRQAHRPTVELDEKIGLEEKQDVDFVGGRAERPSENLERVELRTAIETAMAKLSEEHRAVVWLKEFEDMSYKEIAKTMGCSIGTVMSRLFYARKHLAKLLRDTEIR